MDDHLKDNVVLHLNQLQATVEVRSGPWLAMFQRLTFPVQAQQAKITELENEKRANKPHFISRITRKEVPLSFRSGMARSLPFSSFVHVPGCRRCPF
jgi:hypothetical protein